MEKVRNGEEMETRTPTKQQTPPTIVETKRVQAPSIGHRHWGCRWTTRRTGEGGGGRDGDVTAVEAGPRTQDIGMMIEKGKIPEYAGPTPGEGLVRGGRT